MKKIICLLMGISISVMLLQNVYSLEIPVEYIVKNQVDSLAEMDIYLKKALPLFDVDGNYSYDLYEFENTSGYAIATHSNGYISELMLEKDNPYTEKINKKLYYMGPYNYFYEEDGVLKNVDGSSLLEFEKNKLLFSTDMEDKFEKIREINDEILKTKVNFISTYGDDIWRGTSSTRFERYKDWINRDGTCGHHAAAVILAYSDDYIDDKIVPSYIRTRNSTSAESLISVLVSNIQNVDSGTQPPHLANGMWYIISKQAALDYMADYQVIGTTWSKAVSKIKGWQGCVGIELVKMFGSPYGDHWVVGYQYKENASNKGYFKCHDNHGKYDAVVESSWSIGLVWLDKK